jgi:hypothetical protein
MQRRWWLWVAIGLATVRLLWGRIADEPAGRGGGSVATTGQWSAAPAAGGDRPSTREEARPAWRITVSNRLPYGWFGCRGDFGRDPLGRWVCWERLSGGSGGEICYEDYRHCRRVEWWEARTITAQVEWCGSMYSNSCEDEEPFGSSGFGKLPDDRRWFGSEENDPGFGFPRAYPPFGSWGYDDTRFPGQDSWGDPQRSAFPSLDSPYREGENDPFSTGRDRWP